MKGKSLALLVLALGCGLVASLGITQVLAKRGDAGPPADTVSVFVVKADIVGGSLITQDNVEIQQIPKDRVPAGAIAKQEDLEERRARQNLYIGDVLIEPKLLARGQVPTDSAIPKGYRVVPISVTIESTNGGLVLPGSRCDLQVFIPPNPTYGITHAVCKTILQDIKVFAVNDATGRESKDPHAQDKRSMTDGRTVSLLVTPVQSQIVTTASKLGSVLLILRSSEDRDKPKCEAFHVDELFNTANNIGGDRDKEDQHKQEEARFQKWADEIRKMLRENARGDSGRGRMEEREKFTMRVRSGPDVSDVLLVSNSEVQTAPDEEGVWTVSGLSPSAHGKSSSQPAGTATAANAATPAGQNAPAGPAQGASPAAPAGGPAAPALVPPTAAPLKSA